MNDQRGVTLIELMIVVAIVAILAGLGSIAYGRYMTGAKIEKLRSYAMAVQSGQERFKSRNNVYWNGGLLAAGNKDDYANLLDFAPKALPSNVTVTTVAWDVGGACAICVGAGFDNTATGYAVQVTGDFNPDSAAATTILITNTTENPVLMFEGE